MNTMNYNAEKLDKINYDPHTGFFTWNKHHRKMKPGDPAGTVINDKYLRLSIDGKLYNGLRVAWIKLFNRYPCDNVKPIDGNSLNTRSDNLICNGVRASDELRGLDYDIVYESDGRWSLIETKGAMRRWLKHYASHSEAAKIKDILLNKDPLFEMKIDNDPLKGKWFLTTETGGEVKHHMLNNKRDALSVALAVIIQLQSDL